MINSIFKQTVFISILGHLALFSMFSFSFGPKIFEGNFVPVSFWGAILPRSDFIFSFQAKAESLNKRCLSEANKTRALIKKSDTSSQDRIDRESLLAPYNYLKPQMTLASNKAKTVFAQNPMPDLFISRKKEPTIMFYPRLPYHFTLYFKDREVVHIELMFGVVSNGKRESIAIKRRISSGNLEVDLLAMRYIDRYLFVQKMGSVPNNWQVVKIDLQAKEH